MKRFLTKTVLLLLATVTVLSVMPVAVSAEEGDGVVYNVRPVHSGGNYISGENYHASESEHFQILWGDLNNSFITDAWLELNLAQFEACWKLYVGDLGMTPPSLSTRKNGDQETHYKVNIIVWGTGLPGFGSDVNEWGAYGSIDDDGYAFMMCCRDSLTAVGASESWVVPHEFGHATQFAQGYNSWANCTYLGPWYEAIGNWYREQYLYSDYYTAGLWHRTDLSPLILRASSLTATNGRAYYEAWPIFQYLTENPDGLEGYGSDFVATLLQNGSSSGYIYNMIEELAEAPLDDTLGYFAAHMATLDLQRQSSYMAKINEAVNDQWFFWQQFYTMLGAVPGEADTYIVPSERAPQAAGYVVAPLTVTGDEISVTLRGLTAVDGAAWRACIVTVSGEETLYSELFGDGETMKVSTDGVETAYLTVAATPRLDTYVKFTVFESEAVVSFKDKTRYPFEAVITGAAPAEREIEAGARGSAHPNGGGFVARSAKVDDTVYVAPGAMVLGGTVTGNVRIEDHAVVMGSAKVSDNAVVGGYAIVAGNAIVKDNAYVGDFAVVTGSGTVSGDGRVIESAYLSDTFTVTDNATAKGLALCVGYSNGKLSGDAVADGDFFDDSGREYTSGTLMGYFPGFNGDEAAIESYVSSQAPLNKLTLGYMFGEPNDPMTANEQNGSTYATVFGAEWNKGSRDTALGIYTFADETQYILIDGESVSTRDVQIELKARYDGGDGAILTYEGAGGSMTLTPKNADGKAELTLTVGGETVTLTAKKSLPAGVWSTVTVTFVGGKAALTIDGETHAVAETSLTPADIKANYGRLGGCEFAADSIRFYSANKTSAPMEVTAKDEAETGGDAAATTPTTEAEGTDNAKGGCGSSLGAAPVAVLAIAAAVLGKKKKR